MGCFWPPIRLFLDYIILTLFWQYYKKEWAFYALLFMSCLDGGDIWT